MFGRNPYAPPISSFERPVPLILIDPLEDANYSVCFNKAWLPYILGSLQQLILRSTWDSTDQDAIGAQIERSNQLISAFMSECGDCLSGNCREYTPSNRIIEYAPQNPFTETNVVPPGYINPAWHLVDSADVASHIGIARIGDVTTGWLSFPVTTPALGVGLARFRVHVQGTGRCDVHLLQIPNGGAVLVTQDDNPFTVRTFELDRDLVSIPPETADIIVVESTFDTDGDHHVDFTFFPRFNDSPVFLGYGGGLRKVVLCGALEPPYPNPVQVPTIINEMEYELAICEQLRFQNGKLQGLCCGEWQDITGQDGINLSDAPQQGDGAPQALPSNCQAYHAVFAAASQYLVPTVVSAGDTISFANIKGAGQDGGVSPWHCPDGLTFFAGACVGIAGSAATGDPDMAAPHMSLVVKIGTTWYRAEGSITVPGDVSNSEIIIQANDSTLSDNSGSYALDVTVCNNQTASLVWSHSFDFAISPNGYSAIVSGGETFGNWVAGFGWQSVTLASGNQSIAIHKAATPVNTTSVEFIYDSTVSMDNFGYNAYAMLGGPNAATGTLIHFTITGSVTPSDSRIDVEKNSSTTLYTLRSVILRGTGVDPF